VREDDQMLDTVHITPQKDREDIVSDIEIKNIPKTAAKEGRDVSNSSTETLSYSDKKIKILKKKKSSHRKSKTTEKPKTTEKSKTTEKPKTKTTRKTNTKKTKSKSKKI
jgi:hypothetical protein